MRHTTVEAERASIRNNPRFAKQAILRDPNGFATWSYIAVEVQAQKCNNLGPSEGFPPARTSSPLTSS